MTVISNSVVHLTMRYQKNILSIGTGVIYKHKDEYFIVTAWHNVTGLHSEKMVPLDNKKAAIPDNIIVNLAIAYNEAVGRQSIVLPLTDSEKSLFYIHRENYPRVDVAVIPFNPYSSYLMELSVSSDEILEVAFCPMDGGGKVAVDICPIQKYMVPDPNVAQKWLTSVEVTEELFIPGYPHNVQDYYSQPVWKRATIASSVQQGWNKEPKFLIDSASKSGMSGSPVLFYNPNGTVKIMGVTYRFNTEIAIFAGIYVGRMAIDEKEDPQIGIVWKESVVREIIDGKCWEKLPAEITLSHKELILASNELLKTCSPKGLANVRNIKMPSRYYLSKELLRFVNSRASAKNALEAMVEAAETYNGPLLPEEA